MTSFKEPFPFPDKTLKEDGLTWTALTYAKVLRGPFTFRDLNSISEIKFPMGSKTGQGAIRHLIDINLLKKVDLGVYQITREGIEYVYIVGQYFSKKRRHYGLNLGD